MTTTREPTARELLRDGLLDAAGDLLDATPWSEISMAAVAAQAGVSRQTLYNEFGSRGEFAQIFVLRAADRFLSEVEGAFEEAALDPARALEDGFRRFLELAGEDAMVRRIVTRDQGTEELLSLFTTHGGPVVEMGRNRLAFKMLEIWPDTEPAAVQTIAEAIVRLGISYASLPATASEDAAKQIGELLGPFIRAHLSDA